MSFLTPRLLSIASLISDGEIVADIGTDHGYLPIYLAKDNKASEIFACDIADGPILIAKNNFNSFGVSEKIKLIKSDGIQYFNDSNIHIDVCVIAGMGSSTILDILKHDSNNFDGYIISSNTDLDKIRLWIKSKKYFIEKELLVEDNKIIYEIIRVNKFAGVKVKNYKDVVFGPILRKENSKLFFEKWLSKEGYFLNIYKTIPKKSQNYKTIFKKLKKIKNILKRYTKNEKNKS